MKLKALSILLSVILILGAPVCALAATLPDGVPSTIETVKIDKIEIKYDDDGFPYFSYEILFPQSILDLDAEHPTDGAVYIDYEWQIDNGQWELFTGGYIDIITDPENAVPGKTNIFYDRTDPIDEGNLGEINIKAHTYSFRIRLYYQYNYGEGPGEWDYIYSPYSNVVTLGIPSFYSKANEWAKPELQSAADLGLIPDILKGADMTKPITREEFCELAVLLYESVTGVEAEPVSPNPFNDTVNVQLLKAFTLGITKGMKAGTSNIPFEPKTLINREQCAAMLFRTIKTIKPDGDYSIAGVKDFPDQKYISDWAVEATKYMSKMGILTGDSQGNFMPKATTDAQKAVGYGMATREQAIALTVRTYKKLP